MNYMKSFYIKLLFALSVLIIVACNKNAFLNAKPTSNLVVPSTLTDFQALLDNYNIMAETPALGELSSDEYYLTDDFWQSLSLKKEQNAYVWAEDVYQGQGNVADWNLPYQQVFYANVVLEGLEKVHPTPEQQTDYNALKGAALFIRAYAFYNLAQIFAPIYDSATAIHDPGIPLRLSAEVETPSIRSTVKETYDQIEKDLRTALPLLPVTIPETNRNRPNQPAVYALLARMYLSVGAYAAAGNAADSCLRLYDKLIDYNTLDPTTYLPFTNTNAETMYQSRILSSSQVFSNISYSAGSLVDTAIYQLFSPNDVRRNSLFYFFGPTAININGGYNGTYTLFSGLATDEVYLIRAEATARAGRTDEAMSDLNHLLINRYYTNQFVPLHANSQDEALSFILTERRKELLLRGVRWTDLRRLNKEGDQITLTRILQGNVYHLLPNDPKYVLPIPPDVIQQSGISQNVR